MSKFNMIPTFNMIKSILLILIILFFKIYSYGQPAPQVDVPNFSDKYSNYVKMLEAGQIDIDFQDFRFSFIESEQFKIARKKSTEFDSLKKEMYLQMKKSNSNEIIIITKRMLSIDYTCMLAHKILRQTYKIIGDTVNSTKYKSIQFGLLNSIVKKGNGKTCETSWTVIQVEEEYFILQMLGVKRQGQSIENVGGHCDKIDVKTEEGEIKSYYFEISKVFEGAMKLGIK